MEENVPGVHALERLKPAEDFVDGLRATFASTCEGRAFFGTQARIPASYPLEIPGRRGFLRQSNGNIAKGLSRRICFELKIVLKFKANGGGGMTGAQRERLNEFFVGTFNSVLTLEERALAGAGSGPSIREMHVIEAVAALEQTGRNTMSCVAAALNYLGGRADHGGDHADPQGIPFPRTGPGRPARGQGLSYRAGPGGQRPARGVSPGDA
jgi:hypothetical protein